MPTARKKYIFEILSEVGTKRAKADKIKELQKHKDNWALLDVLRGTYDDNIVWLLPEGAPPYEPAKPENHPADLSREHKKFGQFVKGGPGSKLPAFKREQQFIGLLEGIHPEDAKVIISMTNKKPIGAISLNIVKEAFPELIT